MSAIEQASSQSIKPFKSSEEYLYAMKEDLAEWLKELYRIDVTVNNILDVLETGALLCAHANNVTRVAEEFRQTHGRTHLQLPTSGVTFVSAPPATFLARDNVSNFINWCRHQMNIKDVLMFETDDLVLRKNEKNFVLCLLEVARRASRFGMAAPVLIQLEQEIEEEILEEMEKPVHETTQPVAQRCIQNTQNLDEMVQYLISRCTCPTQFPMVKISDGKYRVGDSNTLIFVRILRNHVMVRVGGGWDTLEHYLDKHDPCRCTSLTHKLAHRPATPVHEIKARPCGPEGQAGSQTILLLSRAQSPLEPVLWSPSAPSRTQRVSPQPRLSYSPQPSLRNCPSPDKLKERADILFCRQTYSESKDDSVLKSTSRTGREAMRVSPSPRLTSSLPRPARPSTPPQPETQRPSTPLVFQRVQSQTSPQHQQGPDNRLGNNWSKSQFVSKLRQTATAGAKSNEERPSVPQKPAGSVSARPFLCITPDLNLNTNKNSLVVHQPPTISIQESDDSGNDRKSPDFIRTFCPSKGLMGVISGKAHARCLIPTGKGQPGGSSDHSSRNTPNLDGNERSQQRFKVSGHQPTGTVSDVHSKSGDQEMENRYLFTPPPISPAQEAVLYQSLEEEILSNLQQLGMDSDASDSENDQYRSRPETPLNSPEMTYEIQKPSVTMSSSASKPNDAKEAQFQAVIVELSNGKKKLEKVSIENWVNSLSRDFKGRKQEIHADTDPNHLKVSKLSVASSWSSLGSSIDSESKRIVETDLTPGNSSNSGTYKFENPQASSFRQKRSLKKPERVPSIYKLKLRPCIHPRRDHRPDKKPSKIPKPVSYRGSQSLDAPQTKMPVDSTAVCYSQKGLDTPHRASTMRHPRKTPQTMSKISPSAGCAKQCQGTDQEVVTDQELETWV
ncbi:GAS2-like protein 2A [Colossoma macropomum]|uniref:GAS2-like protein 2A n=1 Tax=Colossoma macropomum TaxID=42526 RepID=UPI0018648DEF|nr:GAS2-like protein 2A [Colossoma macropomum]